MGNNKISKRKKPKTPKQEEYVKIGFLVVKDGITPGRFIDIEAHEKFVENIFSIKD